ncbi:hypothetical protein R5R35_010500 [Gryllus longicercus]|uniref:BZIP domain-containing protein n=1 Tax=Gryllus longicercus TaxID=2509291 RepID=A0AAN9VM00_9ORTH
MAAFSNLKRKINVHSGSSCSSVVSNENGIETGYISDNSTSDVETVNTYENSVENGFIGKEGNSVLPQCNVVKKELILNAQSRKKLDYGDEVESYPMPRKRANCVSKNALMARANRMKKKQYLEDLEKKLQELSEENEKLKLQVKKNNEIAQKQTEEVKYLKGVLANAPEISTLLKCVRQRSSLPVTSSINKFSDTYTLKESPFDLDDPLLSSCDLESFKELPDTDFLTQDLADKTLDVLEGSSSTNVGICLHVAQQRVSLEFCPTCSINATAAWQDSGFGLEGLQIPPSKTRHYKSCCVRLHGVSP